MDYQAQIQALVSAVYHSSPRSDRGPKNWVSDKHDEIGATILSVFPPDLIMFPLDRGPGEWYGIDRYEGVSNGDPPQVYTYYGPKPVRHIYPLKPRLPQTDYLLKNRLKNAKKDGYEIIGKYVYCDVSMSSFCVEPVIAVIDTKEYKVPEVGKIAIYSSMNSVYMVEVKNLYPASKSDQIAEHAFEAALRNARNRSNISISDKPARVDPDTGSMVIRRATHDRLYYRHRQTYIGFSQQSVKMHVWPEGEFEFSFEEADKEPAERIIATFGPGEYVKRGGGRGALVYKTADLRRILVRDGGDAER